MNIASIEIKEEFVKESDDKMTAIIVTLENKEQKFISLRHPLTVENVSSMFVNLGEYLRHTL